MGCGINWRILLYLQTGQSWQNNRNILSPNNSQKLTRCESYSNFSVRSLLSQSPTPTCPTKQRAAALASRLLARQHKANGLFWRPADSSSRTNQMHEMSSFWGWLKLMFEFDLSADKLTSISSPSYLACKSVVIFVLVSPFLLSFVVVWQAFDLLDSFNYRM